MKIFFAILAILCFFLYTSNGRIYLTSSNTQELTSFQRALLCAKCRETKDGDCLLQNNCDPIKEQKVPLPVPGKLVNNPIFQCVSCDLNLQLNDVCKKFFAQPTPENEAACKAEANDVKVARNEIRNECWTRNNCDNVMGHI